MLKYLGTGEGAETCSCSIVPSPKFIPLRRLLQSPHTVRWGVESALGRHKLGNNKGHGKGPTRLYPKRDLILANALFPRKEVQEGVCQMAKGGDE